MFIVTVTQKSGYKDGFRQAVVSEGVEIRQVVLRWIEVRWRWGGVGQE
jgi:hypothetical protein